MIPHERRIKIRYLPYRYKFRRFPFARRYELLSLIRSAYKTDVFKAYDYNKKRFVAIKFIYFDSPALILNDRQFMERWNRMYRFGKRLKYPNILSILDHGIDRKIGVFFYATSYISGHTLDDEEFLENLSFQSRLGIAIDIANALQTAHKRGVIHRDIKPDNILIDSEGNGYLTDFESAKYTLNPITAPGMTLGTPAFMSPEQIRGEDLDMHSDIYSLGNVYYYLFTGKLPFHRGDSVEISHRIVHEDPIPPKQIKDSIPSWLSDLILKMMAKDPRQRIDSVKDAVEELKKVSGGKNNPA